MDRLSIWSSWVVRLLAGISDSCTHRWCRAGHVLIPARATFSASHEVVQGPCSGLGTAKSSSLSFTDSEREPSDLSRSCGRM